ncbi:MAG: hypothetical protein AAGB93_19955 [Planctomycetota bacterium]
MKSLLALLALVAMPCCRSVRYVQFEAVPSPSDVVEGRTTYGEVLTRYGAPIALGRTTRGFAFIYERIGIDEDSVGVKVQGAGYFGASEGNRAYRSTILLFDGNGLLVQALSRDSRLSTGTGVQVATSGGKDFSAEKDYGAGPSPLGWGQRKLNALPVLLNDRWGAIEVGEGGWELFDTPRDAGQHTLSKPLPLAFKYFNK